jgi:pterin-4a-carbinolamine dehydratase
LANWERRKKPATLSRRFDFPDYAATRKFLDELADLSAEADLYPNISFGATYATLTIEAQDEAGVGEREEGFAAQVDGLINA